ncbi:hypothetical protein D3C80_1959080 [compost metagenome]
MPVRPGFMAGLIDVLRNVSTRRAGRKALLDMDETQLRDIGVTRIAANREAARSLFLI